MGYREYSQLSKADQQHEDTRQKMIVCQSQMERAIEIFTASSPNVEFPLEPSTMECLKKTASELVDWIYEKSQETLPQQNSSNDTLPTPTLAQKKVLDVIWKEIYGNSDIPGGVTHKDVNNLYRKVLRWAKEVHSVDYYPENPASVNKFIEWLNSKGE